MDSLPGNVIVVGVSVLALARDSCGEVVLARNPQSTVVASCCSAVAPSTNEVAFGGRRTSFSAVGSEVGAVAPSPRSSLIECQRQSTRAFGRFL
jgi:hypothetical protein